MKHNDQSHEAMSTRMKLRLVLLALLTVTILIVCYCFICIYNCHAKISANVSADEYYRTHYTQTVQSISTISCASLNDKNIVIAINKGSLPFKVTAIAFVRTDSKKYPQRVVPLNVRNSYLFTSNVRCELLWVTRKYGSDVVFAKQFPNDVDFDIIERTDQKYVVSLNAINTAIVAELRDRSAKLLVLFEEVTDGHSYRSPYAYIMPLIIIQQ